MKLLICILFWVNSFSQVDKELQPYVKQYNDSLGKTLTAKQKRLVVKVELVSNPEFKDDWQTHIHYNAYHVLIAREPKKMSIRKAVMLGLDAAYFKLIDKRQVF